MDADMTFASPAAPSFRDAMRLVAGGVSVVTAGEGEERTGLTVTSTVSLSMEPPAMIICVNRRASALPTIVRLRHFCVNVLSAEQEAVANRFAGVGGVMGAARYEGAEWRPLVTGALALEGALASIDCKVEDIVERFSHAIVIGAVVAVTARSGEPIIYSQGRYRRIERG